MLVLVFIAIVWAASGANNDPSTPLAKEIPNEECKKELKCWGEKYISDATVLCSREIEKTATYQVEWTNTFPAGRFSRYGWFDQKSGAIGYEGDKIKFQNGFGAWQNHKYICLFDPIKNLVITVEVNPGYL